MGAVGPGWWAGMTVGKTLLMQCQARHPLLVVKGKALRPSSVKWPF